VVLLLDLTMSFSLHSFFLGNQKFHLDFQVTC
jgi:hypothetical protein